MVRWLAAGVALIAFGAVAGCDSRAPAGQVRIGIAYAVGNLGDPVNTLVRKGAYQARDKLGRRVAMVREFSAITDEGDEDRYDRLVILCESGYDPVVAVGYGYVGPDPASGPLARAARACPGTRFAIVDDATVSEPNVANLVFADAAGSYLVGVAAGLASTTGVVGFVGGCRIPAVSTFEAGYRAGVTAVRPRAQVRAAYLVTDATRCGPGFESAELARQAADRLYAGGAEVVYQVAGAAGTGVFAAAKEYGALAVGCGADQYQQVSAGLRSVLLTSMTKRVDRAVAAFVEGVVAGQFTPGVHRDGLADGGVGYATSGGRVDALSDRLNLDKKNIIDGKITVPSGL